MGTNYFLRPKPCETCGRADEPIHIGKSSAGWVFLLHVYPDGPGPHDMHAWIKLLQENQESIFDEYGDPITFESLKLCMLARVGSETWEERRKQIPRKYRSWETFHKTNSSCEGPFGLLRQKSGTFLLIRSGEGTWDECSGDFS